MLESNRNFHGTTIMPLKFLQRLLNKPHPAAPASADERQNAFAAQLMDRLHTRHPNAGFSYDPQKFIIRGDHNWMLNLANLYQDFSHLPEAERQQMIEDIAQGLDTPDAPVSYAEARKQLLPALRNLAGLELIQIDSGQALAPADFYAQWGVQPFSPELGIITAYDTEHAVQQISPDDLRRWQVTPAQALEEAIANLRDKASAQFRQHQSGFYISCYNDYYDAARILLPELAWQLPLAGNPVAMIPNRICMLIAGDRDLPALQAMLRTAEEVLFNQGRPLSAEMFRLEDRTWQAWTPPAPLILTQGNLLRRMRAGDYHAQQQALLHRMENTGQDIVIANYALLRQTETGHIISYTVLTEGHSIWFPEVDLLVFERKDEVTVRVPWTRAIRYLAPLCEKLPYHLPRYQLNRYPDAALLAAMQT